MEEVEEANNVERKKSRIDYFLCCSKYTNHILVTGEVKERENVVQQSFLAI